MLLVGLLVFSCLIEVYYEQSHANFTAILGPYILESVKSYDPCQPMEPITLNYSSQNLRISERKCFEYIERVENHMRREKWTKRCEKRFDLEPDIFGGHLSLTDEFPHMGAVGWKAKDRSVKWVFKCGSTLISEKFLLTAAHCSKLSLRSVSDVIQRQPEIVRLGQVDISDKKPRGIQFFGDCKINLIIVHPKYASPGKYYDIALIQLQEEVNFIKGLHPACLWPNDNFDELGNEALITGWGYTEHGHLSEILQVATVHVLETSLCEQLLEPYHNRNWRGFQNHQICAGELAGGTDTCQGDSGGPIQIKMPLDWNDSSYYWILGVTSFGIMCGDTNRPGIYTRVSSFIEWIEEVVWEPIK